MRARTRPARAAYRGSDGGPAVRAAAGMVLGAGAAAAAVALTPSVHRAAVAGVAAVAALLWCGLVGYAATLGTRARAAERTLADVRRELAETGAAAGALHTELTATHTAAGALRAALANAQAEAGEIRTELDRARADEQALRAELGTLHEAHSAAVRERTELAALRDQVLPAVVARLRAGASVDTALAGHDLPAHHALLRAVAEAVGRGERQRAAALAVCATAAGRVQALATSMHAELREMQHRHGEDVLGDLLELDHATAQVGRMADSIAVLTGARSGRRWTKPIGVESILRGALGRIGAYQRVRLHNASTAAVAGFAAEGVMHVLAELLDNAANFSAPPSEVHVYVEEAHSGLVVTVEDGGLGLSDSWLRRAEQAVSAQPLDLSALSAGTRLGLAVVGSLARKHGLSISFRPSARGGTGVVVLVPEQLISHPAPALARALAAAHDAAPAPAAVRPAGTGRPVLEPAPAVAPAGAEDPDRTHDSEAGNEAGTDTPPAARTLPQRRRGQTLAAATPPAAPTPAARSERAAALSAARFGAFRKALQGAESPDAHSKDDA
ncbi:histidine kinase/DNA gyrase B/HSP90-like ATPase [Streptomyces sp. TLI_235]|nr:ATP-binding protein [Streptomyces sp. TLI_235]PBC77479.1 histidine kinase/DNA gyrase B/HSP90-like ATPase [Streptomyces sp. TLI_235]